MQPLTTIAEINFFTGAAVSGTGATAVLKPKPNLRGLAVLTFTMAAGSGCITRTFSKNIWVGKPLLTVAVNQQVYCAGIYGTAQIPDAYAQGLSNLQWIKSGPISAWNSQGGVASFIAGPGTGSATIRASASNVCGSEVSTPTGFGVVACMLHDEGDLGGQNDGQDNEAIAILASPNPVRNNLHITLSETATRVDITTTFNFYDTFGHLVKKIESPSTFCTLNMKGYVPGVYQVQALCEGKAYYKKVLVSP